MISSLDVLRVHQYPPTIFNSIIAQLTTVILPPSVDNLAYPYELHSEIAQVDKLQKALNAVDKGANSLGLY